MSLPILLSPSQASLAENVSLMGAADPIWKASVGGVSAFWHDWHAQSEGLARGRLGERAFLATWRRGAALSMAEIVSRLSTRSGCRLAPRRG